MLKTLVDLKNKKQVRSRSVRDYIIIYLCIGNAYGTGTLANMTCGEFSRARQENGSYQVAVFNNTTIVTSGPAKQYFLQYTLWTGKYLLFKVPS